MTWIVEIAYYCFLEGLWGRSLGKQLLGLRVIDEARQRPGIRRALARAALWVICIGAPTLAYNYAMAPVVEASQDTPLGSVLGFSVPLLILALALVIFITARRGNGYTGLHDLATHTRVIVKRASEGRARVALRIADQPPADRPLRAGPYIMLEERPLGGDHILVGYDDRLRRRVWIRRVGIGEPPVPAERRQGHIARVAGRAYDSYTARRTWAAAVL